MIMMTARSEAGKQQGLRPTTRSGAGRQRGLSPLRGMKQGVIFVFFYRFNHLFCLLIQTSHERGGVQMRRRGDQQLGAGATTR